MELINAPYFCRQHDAAAAAHRRDWNQTTTTVSIDISCCFLRRLLYAPQDVLLLSRSLPLMGIRFLPLQTVEIRRLGRLGDCKSVNQTPIDFFETRDTPLYRVKERHEYTLGLCCSQSVMHLSFSFANIPQTEAPHFCVRACSLASDSSVCVQEVGKCYYMSGKGLHKLIFSFLVRPRNIASIYKLKISGRVNNIFFSESIAFICPP